MMSKLLLLYKYCIASILAHHHQLTLHFSVHYRTEGLIPRTGSSVVYQIIKKKKHLYILLIILLSLFEQPKNS